MNHLEEAKHNAQIFQVDGYHDSGDWLPVVAHALIAIAEQLEKIVAANELPRYVIEKQEDK